MYPRAVSATRLLAGLAATGALLLSPVATERAAASVSPPVLSSLGLCGSPQLGHRTCMVRVLTVNGRRFAAPLAAPAAGYSPADIRSAYGISAAAGGGGQTVAVIDAYDNPNAESDLAAYRSQWGLPPCSTANGCFRKADEHGGTSYPAAASRNDPNDPSYGWASEIDLDIEAVSAACPLCHILLLEGAAASDIDFINSIATAPTLGATEMSLSFGGCEQAGDQGQFDTALSNAALPITASSGDSGYLSADNPAQQNVNTRCATAGGAPLDGSPSFPASSPYVTAVGGTTLTRAGGTPRGWTETAWAYSPTHTWGGGSGCSTDEAKPAWQKDAGCSNRMVADIAAVADPQTGLAVYDTWDSSGWGVYGGTSLSAPLVAGIVALSGGGPPGTPGGQPWYKAGVALNDVLAGSNAPIPTDCAAHPYFCNAGIGYDGPTGLGSPAGTLAPPPPPPPGVFHPTAPFRVADTRPGSGQPLQGQTLGAGRSVNVPIVGVDGVPGNATAAVLNVTATGGSTPSYLTVFPGGTSAPLASNLNTVAGQTVANLVTVPIGPNGGVGIYNHSGTVDVIVDLEGYFLPGAGHAGLYNPVDPARITDTRPGSGQPNAGNTLATNGTLVVQVAGAGGVPPSGVSAVVLNVTAVGPTLASFLTAFADGTARPLASNLNVTRGEVVPNRVIVSVGSDGAVDLFNQQGRVDVVVDVGGWFTDGTVGGTGSRFTPVTPTRVADTRAGSGEPLAGSTLTSGATRSVAVAGVAGLPATGVLAVAANVTVADTTTASYLAVYPDGTSQPTASDLNWVAGQVVPNLAISRLGSDGGMTVFNHQGRVDVIVDVFGYWS